MYFVEKAWLYSGGKDVEFCLSSVDIFELLFGV